MVTVNYVLPTDNGKKKRKKEEAKSLVCAFVSDALRSGKGREIHFTKPE